MRKKDWADREAESLFDQVRDAIDDEVVEKSIAEALRRAFFDGLVQNQKGITYSTSRGGDISGFICTALKEPSESTKLMERTQIAEGCLELESHRDYKLTWDGKKSKNYRRELRGKKKMGTSS